MRSVFGGRPRRQTGVARTAGTCGATHSRERSAERRGMIPPGVAGNRSRPRAVAGVLVTAVLAAATGTGCGRAAPAPGTCAVYPSAAEVFSHDDETKAAEPTPAGTDGVETVSAEAVAEIDLDDLDLGDLDLGGLDLENMSLEDLAVEDANPLAGCVMCHTDVGDRFTGSRHHKEEISCVDCHGPSDGHVADENNDVKPDETFAREDTDRLCGACHGCDRRIPSNWATIPPQDREVCTECHGSHALVDVAASVQGVE